MPHQNRVTPTGEIIATPARGMFFGNRGCIHDDSGVIKREFQVKRWIICLLEFKGRKRPLLQPGKYTELFFLDEATALSAGHRPCAECQRERLNTYKALWSDVNGVDLKSLGVDDMDNLLHPQRLAQQKPRAKLDDLPDGVFIRLEGNPTPYLIYSDHLFPWQPEGYGQPLIRPHNTDVTLLTPPANVAIIKAGFAPVIHPSAKV